MSWSEEQVIALSPDEASTKSGKDLARLEKWVSINKDEKALWGECKGSGSKPYQTQIDLNNIAFKCTCPSRKFPCKHGLGLLLLFAKTPDSFKDSEAPEWVKDWLSKRTQREEKKADKKDKPVDEAAQAKRLDARQLKVADGVEELIVWMKDIIRNGILTMPEKPHSYWETMARRMVDAQAPGLGRMVQALGNNNFYSENWQSIFLDQLIKIYLVIKGYQNISDQPFSLQEDIKNFIGFSQNQEELKEQTGITDTWMVLSKQSIDEGNITTERYWLYGNQSKQYALILQFIVNGQGKNLTITPGMSIKAELIYFPSVVPLRAIIKRQITSDTTVEVLGYNNWMEIAQEETRTQSLLPFIGERPFIIKNVRLVFQENKWLLADENNAAAYIKESFKFIFHLLAISGGESFTSVVLGSENIYEPVGLWFNNKYYVL